MICSISIPSIILGQAIMYYGDNAGVDTANVDLFTGIRSILCDGPKISYQMNAVSRLLPKLLPKIFQSSQPPLA